MTHTTGLTTVALASDTTKQVGVKFPGAQRVTQVVDVPPGMTVREFLTALHIWGTHDLRNACPERPDLGCAGSLFKRIEDGDLLYASPILDTS